MNECVRFVESFFLLATVVCNYDYLHLIYCNNIQVIHKNICTLDQLLEVRKMEKRFISGSGLEELASAEEKEKSRQKRMRRISTSSEEEMVIKRPKKQMFPPAMKYFGKFSPLVKKMHRPSQV